MLFFLGMAIWRVSIPRGAALVGAAIYGVLNFGVSYALYYFGLQTATAGTASVMLATVPLWTFFLAIVHGLERFRLRALIGTIVATLGIAVVFIDQLSTAVPFVALVAMLGGAATAAEAGVVAKRFPRTHPLSTNAVGMLVGGALLGALSLAVGEAQGWPQRLDTQIALLYLATIGAVGLFALFLFVLGRWTASASSYSIVIMPLVAIAAGALLRGEAVSPFFIVGAVVVGIGVYIGALSG